MLMLLPSFAHQHDYYKIMCIQASASATSRHMSIVSYCMTVFVSFSYYPVTIPVCNQWAVYSYLIGRYYTHAIMVSHQSQEVCRLLQPQMFFFFLLETAYSAESRSRMDLSEKRYV